MNPLVSIIIPCYNCESYIDQAISSCLSQSYSNIEIIVIDDGSSDSSLNVIQSFGTKVNWETGNNKGAQLSRNRGLEISTGEYIKFLDADDLLFPHCINSQVEQSLTLSPNQKAIVYGDASLIDGFGNIYQKCTHQPRLSSEEPIAHILQQSPLTSCPLHRRDYLIEVDGFDPSLHNCHENDLHLRLVLSSVNFVYFPEPVYMYRQYTDENRITNQRYSSQGPLAFYKILQKQIQNIKTYSDLPLSKASKKALSQRFWGYGRGILREGYEKEAKMYFSAAQQLDAKHCVNGSNFYTICKQLLGPYLAEKLLINLKSVYKKNS